MKKINKSICIEFVGIWGAGKSTIIKQISKNLKEIGLIVARDSDYLSYSRFMRYKSAFQLFFLNPLYFINWLWFSLKIFLILKPTGKIEIDIYLTLIKANIIKNSLLKKRPDVILLEGSYHLLPVFKKMKNMSNKDLLFSIPTVRSCSKSHVVFIETKVQTALNRVLMDHKNKLQRFSNKELKNLKNRYSIMIENQKKIKEIINSKEIICLDGEESINLNLNYLQKFILNLLNLSYK